MYLDRRIPLLSANFVTNILAIRRDDDRSHAVDSLCYGFVNI